MKIDKGLKKISGIYQIVCGNRCYIGSSVNLWERLLLHRAQLRANIHHSRFMQRCYNKYGEKNFNINILETGIFSEEVLRNKEYDYIKEYKPAFNSTTPITYERSEEMKLSISNTLKKKYASGEIINWRLNKGRKFHIYDFIGNLLYSSVDVNFCINFLKISNRSVIDNSLRKGRFIFRNEYLIIPENRSLVDCVHQMLEKSKLTRRIIPMYQVFDSGKIIKCTRSSITRVVDKTLFSENYTYYSKKNKSFYTFIGLISSAVLNRNV